MLTNFQSEFCNYYSFACANKDFINIIQIHSLDANDCSDLYVAHQVLVTSVRQIIITGSNVTSTQKLLCYKEKISSQVRKALVTGIIHFSILKQQD